MHLADEVVSASRSRIPEQRRAFLPSALIAVIGAVSMFAHACAATPTPTVPDPAADSADDRGASAAPAAGDDARRGELGDVEGGAEVGGYPGYAPGTVGRRPLSAVPTGKIVAFSNRVEDDASQRLGPGEGGMRTDAWLIDAATGERTRLWSAAEAWSHGWTLDPQGRSIAYPLDSSEWPSGGGIGVRRIAQGADVVPVVTVPDRATVAGFLWEPEGDALLYGLRVPREGGGWSWQLRRVSMDGTSGAGAVPSGDELVYETRPEEAALPLLMLAGASATRDSVSLLAANEESEPFDLLLFDAGEGRLEGRVVLDGTRFAGHAPNVEGPGRPSALTAFGPSAAQVAVSPDGTKVAWHSGTEPVHVRDVFDHDLRLRLGPDGGLDAGLLVDGLHWAPTSDGIAWSFRESTMHMASTVAMAYAARGVRMATKLSKDAMVITRGGDGVGPRGRRLSLAAPMPSKELGRGGRHWLVFELEPGVTVGGPGWHADPVAAVVSSAYEAAVPLGWRAPRNTVQVHWIEDPNPEDQPAR